MDLGVGVVEADELVEGLRAGVDLDAARIVVDDEAVVRLGGFGAQGELFVGVELGVGLDGACGDGVVVDDLVEVAGKSDAGAFDRRAAGDVEVAESNVSQMIKSCRSLVETHLWFVKAITVSSTSSPTSSTSYSISRLVFSTPSIVSMDGMYQSLISTVPGKPSSPSLLRYLNMTLSLPFLLTGVGPSKSFLPHPTAPPCRVLGPLFTARS